MLILIQCPLRNACHGASYCDDIFVCVQAAILTTGSTRALATANHPPLKVDDSWTFLFPQGCQVQLHTASWYFLIDSISSSHVCRISAPLLKSVTLILIKVREKHPRISFGRAGKKRETFIDPKTSTTIKVEFSRPYHKYFKVRRSNLKDPKILDGQPAIPAIPSSHEEFTDLANLETISLELHFPSAQGKHPRMAWPV